MLASGASPLPPAVLEQVQTAIGPHDPRGLRPDRDRAGGHQHAGLAGGQAGLDRPADARRRGAAGRRGRRRRPRTTTRARSGSAARTCSRATGRTAAGGPDADGWWATGDVAYADEDGDLFLVDRRKELVIVSGFNVYPREVEDALAEHPDVAEVAVIGVPHPYTGEAVKAFVVPRAGAGLRPRTSPRTRPPGWPGSSGRRSSSSSAALPHSATGKVAKGRLRDEASAERGDGAAGHPDRQARLPPVRRGPGGGRAR